MESLIKSALREELKRKRLALSAKRVDSFSQKISEKLIELINWQVINSVHSYVPIKRQHEIDTYPIFEYIWHEHPKIKTFVPDGKLDGISMAYRIYLETTWLSDYGVPIPKEKIMSAPNEVYDLIIVPLIGFDKNLHRIGYGGGYYDRLLTANNRALKVGLGYDGNLVMPNIFVEPHDIPLDVIITEKRELTKLRSDSRLLVRPIAKLI